ncbi:MAG: hypothetical protein AAB403_24485 [Planctomycetota bacterium]
MILKDRAYRVDELGLGALSEHGTSLAAPSCEGQAGECLLRSSALIGANLRLLADAPGNARPER